jgi:hypothetical protein
MKYKALFLMLACFGTAHAAEPVCKAAISDKPLVMRIGKDEFRIAFSVTGEGCAAKNCSGTIRYQAAWRTEEGVSSTENKLVSFNIPDGAKRSIAVDRHYFDTAEGKHTTDLVDVTVEKITCQAM